MKKFLLTRQNKLCLLTCFLTLFCTLQPWNVSAQTYPFVKQTDIDETLWAGNYIIAFYDPSDPNNQYAFNATPVNTAHFSIGTQIQLSADFNTIENIGASKIVSVEYGGQYKEDISVTGILAGTHYYYISYEKDGNRYYLSGESGELTLEELSARPLTSKYRWFFYKDGEDFFIRNCYGKIWLRAVTSQHKIHLHNAIDNNQPVYLYRWANDNYHEININSAGMGSISCLGTAMSNSYSDYIAYPDSVVTIVTKPSINFVSLTVTDEDDNELTLTDNHDGTFTFIMPESNVTIDVNFSSCEEFTNYSGAVATAIAENNAGASGFKLPEGWKQIKPGDKRFSAHLYNGSYAKSQNAILANAGKTSDSYYSAENNNTYLISPYWLHEGDVISFNAWTAPPGDVSTMQLFYGYLDDPVDPTDKTKFVSLGEATTIVSNNIPTGGDPSAYGRSTFVVPAAADGHWLVFRWYVNSNNYAKSVVLDNICISEQIHLWTEYVTEDPGTEHFEVDASGNVTIKSKEGLAWLISYVNGLNGVEGGAHDMSGNTVTLTADVDMSEHVWVPIGVDENTPFSGTFDGQCFTIDSIHIKDATEVGYVEGSDNGTYGDMQYTGMFGYTNEAKIKNTFLTSGSLACDGENGYLGGLVGNANNTNIEFCESALALTAVGSLSAVGGIVGQASGSTIKAVMAVGDITINDDVISVGGITGSDGTVMTFYTNHTISGSGTVTTKNTAGDNGYSITSNVGYNMGITGFTAPTAYTYGSYSTNNTISGTPLVDLLNDDIFGASDYKWMRSTSQTINGDYPIIVKRPANAEDHAIAVINATTDGKVVRYGDINSLLGMEKYQNAAYSVYMYNNYEITTAPVNTELYIDEHVAMTQSAACDPITAHVGITLKNPKGKGEMSRDWHMFSTSLQNPPLGILYSSGNQSQHGYLPNAENYLIFGENQDYWIDENGYFPANITNRTQFDFYSYYEPEYHWINLKRKLNNHWHEDEIDGDHPNINYNGEHNQTELEQGKGYLVALGNTSDNNNLMQAKGVLNNGIIDINVTNSGNHLTGYNLLGNPYQSYLDFVAFVNYGYNATNLWKDVDTVGTKAFMIYDAEQGGYVEYLMDGDETSFSMGAEKISDQYIHPHQSFFVVKNIDEQGSTTVRFNNDMRDTTAKNTVFRSQAPTYPLVNLECTDSEGKWEHSVIELERPLSAGSLKMKGMLNSKANMYIHWNGVDYGSVFIDYMPDYVPVWFETSEDGVFTFTWNTANANFGYMHLIDHLTGTDYDCLAPGNDHYTFEAKTTDMVARFRLVFKPLGIEENEVENANFAFFNGEQLIVNGSGDMQLIDVNGRILMTEHLSGEQNSISLPNVAAGVYMLRMIGDSESRIQKIVVRK